jgi:alcohol dehydrogenase class IV
MFKNYVPTKLVFGEDSLNELPEYIKKYGRKVLLIGPSINVAIKPMFDRVICIMNNENIDHIDYFKVEPNPSSNTVDEVFTLAKINNVDCIVAMGGGSVLDVAKIIKTFIDKEQLDWEFIYNEYNDYKIDYPSVSKIPLPLIAISTTAGTGSENTQASVITSSLTQEKLTVFHPDSYPDVAIVDPRLHMTLPGFISASTAFDAFTHAFESYLNNNDNPIMEMYQLKAINNIIEYLPKVLNENKIEYREKIALGSTLAGISLANCGACLPHPLSEIIGSDVTRLSHGQALAMVYPYFIKFTADKYETKFAKICRIFDKNYYGVTDNVAAECFNVVLSNYLKDCNLEFKLRDYADEEMINKIKALEVWNHLPMEKTSVIKDIVNEICK